MSKFQIKGSGRKRHLGDIGRDEGNLLKCLLYKWNVRNFCDMAVVELNQVTVCYEYDIKP
jgi:hypothetical protein